MKSQNKKIAYCFLVSNEPRDAYILLPYIYYLEKFENFHVQIEFIWDAHIIRKKRPDLVILPNIRGHNLNYEVAKYCSDNEILVYASDSEGNFNSEIDYNFWGYNITKELICPIQFTWNNRIKNYLNSVHNIAEKDIVVSGAPGFDKYQYLTYKSREDIISKYNLNHFNKVVGYAGWAFGKIYNKELSDVLTILEKNHDEGVAWLTEQRDIVESCLKTAIESNPDTLFILKKHPRENFESDGKDSRNEMNQLVKYPNVLYLKDEEEIQNLIAISDLWIAFESTSIMEAWLLGIPTLMINDDSNFTRSKIHEGSIVARNEAETSTAIKELFDKKNKNYFFPEDVVQRRNEIFDDSIGFTDGLNHLRCAKAFSPFIASAETKATQATFQPKFFRLYYLLHIGKYFYIPWLFKRLPKFKKTVWVFENYSLKRVKEIQGEINQNLDHFYASNDLNKKINTGEIWNKL
jgi:surface carbohydrate biosynthesis protein|tara:strand:+ start:3382 stop:4770 length:1389 start_codon:yes stop_codon:yes gene_type:complete